MYRLLPKTKKKLKPASVNSTDGNLPAALVTLRAKLNSGQIENLVIRQQISDRFDLFDSTDAETELIKCKEDIAYWINNWCWTLDPRVEPKLLPFVLFERQIEYLEWRSQIKQNKENGICEKSRDMGVSWLNVCDHVHSWLFEDGYQGGLGSRKEKLVDTIGDPKSLFEKARMLLRNFPKWMLPKGFNWRRDDNYMKLINPENGATITGEAGDNIGRGGRTTIYDVDEAAFLERPMLVDGALSNNTNTIFYTSSANGTGNLFYKKRSDYPPECIFRFYWRSDPRKDDEWRAAQDRKYEPETVASEVEIDYTASDANVFIPANHVQAAVDLQSVISHQSSVIKIAALDVADLGKDRNVFGVREGNKVIHIQYWQGIDTTQTANKVAQLCVEWGISILIFDTIGVGAGVAGTLNSMQDLSFHYVPFQSAGKPSDTWWDSLGKFSYERFANARAEGWGILADKLKKTYDHINQIQEYSAEELINLPLEPLLISQLSMPAKKWTNTGKILVESKKDMASRGIKSPDYADMVMMLFHPLAMLDEGISLR